jgi:ornithine cyclodeaminase/alanine dehydrogenase-like protein (mu-crystallin family)
VAEWVLALERAYVAAATSGAHRELDRSIRGLAGAGAIASRYLAVGTPRSFAIIGDDAGAGLASIEAHRTWFEPRDIRCTSAALGVGRVVTLAEALAADIVCIHEPLSLAASQLRRGTHVNALAAVTLDHELRALAMIVDDARGLPALAAGLVDGRQLDEITVYIAIYDPRQNVSQPA